MEQYLAIYEIEGSCERIPQIFPSENDEKAKEDAQKLGEEIKKIRKIGDPDFSAQIKLFSLYRLIDIELET